MRYLALPVVMLSLSLPARAQIDPSTFSAMTARNVGPAGMSGRVSVVDVVESDPNVIYVGAATGGVWKSVDGGLTWTPIFDDQTTSSIGFVAVNQVNPDIVWVGTGEGNPRNSAGVGRGVFRSLDGGRSWTHLGLERSERIHRIALHPTDPDIAYVGALGPTWSDGEERGVFKTRDGGTTWERVLFVNARTGASDLVMDPVNPNKLFAAMWEHRRWPWFFESGGPGSGLYVTYDGGETWTRLSEDNGLPAGTLGRSGLAIARHDPRIVYALVEAEQSALLRSDDGGHHFETINDRPGIAPRPFYYADIRVDPMNENRVYSLYSRITVSEDQGRNFETVVPSALIHGDVHELWIHPENPRFMIMGNDGGIGITYNRGATWRFVENLPLAQFYQLSVDNELPFNVYGGLQDNGSWFGPSASWYDGPIRNYYWTRVGGGDGFATFTDFGDPRYGYTESQQGFVRRFDKNTGERKDIRPVHPDGMDLRFNWNAALTIDPFDSSVVYLGSQFVHHSRDHGASWEIISPDLTTNDPDKQRSMESGGLTRDASGAENHTTIITIAPSGIERGLIWVGTDDGNVQLTRDGGETWTNVVERIRDVPATTWVSHIEPSKFDGGTAFVAFDDHRRGNWETYLYKTSDYGRTWTNLATDDVDGFVHTIEQDPEAEDLLFVGTEFGMYVSLDGGGQWWKWTHGLPTAPVRALVVHPRDHDLAIGTHGRAAFILDDIRPLRALSQSPEIAQRPLHLFEIPTAYQHTVAESSTAGYRSTGHAMFGGDNRPYGASITYVVGDLGEEDEATIDILDDADRILRTMTAPTSPGVNRVIWDLRRTGFPRPTRQGGAEADGPEVLPGTYTVRIRAGDHSVSGPLTVRFDPRHTITEMARRAKNTTLEDVARHTEAAARVMDRIRSILQGIEAVNAALEGRADTDSELHARGDALLAAVSAVSDRIVPPEGGRGLVNTRHLIASRLDALYGSLQSSWDTPTESQRLRLRQIANATVEVVAAINALLAGDVGAYRRAAAAEGLDLIPQLEPVQPD